MQIHLYQSVNRFSLNCLDILGYIFYFSARVFGNPYNLRRLWVWACMVLYPGSGILPGTQPDPTPLFISQMEYSPDTYFPVSRGLIEHLCIMSDYQIKVYLYLLSNADYTGKDKGKVKVKAAFVAKFLGIERSRLYKVLKSLSKHYISVKYSSSRFGRLVIDIKRFKTVPDFYSGHIDHGTHHSTHHSKGTVTPLKSRRDNELRTPNKEEVIKNKYSVSFEEFWTKFPRKVGKGQASKSWIKATRNTKLEIIMLGLSEQLPALVDALTSSQGNFCPHPATWLNGERWLDDHKAPEIADPLDMAL